MYIVYKNNWLDTLNVLVADHVCQPGLDLVGPHPGSQGLAVIHYVGGGKVLEGETRAGAGVKAGAGEGAGSEEGVRIEPGAGTGA